MRCTCGLAATVLYHGVKRCSACHKVAKLAAQAAGKAGRPHTDARTALLKGMTKEERLCVLAFVVAERAAGRDVWTKVDKRQKGRRKPHDK